MNEPGILATVKHVQASLPATAEIIVVVNHAASAEAAIRQQNAQSISELRQHSEAMVLTATALPSAQAGVGTARKLGMDEAMLRLASVGCADGLIASLDADCRVDADYGQRLLDQAAAQPKQHAMLCEFAHPLEQAADAAQRQAIIDYELFLRTITAGWRLAGLPYAFTAMGSCMVVRANAYARHSGMNRRQAGEDFYFMHKLAREREVITLPQVRVYPSPRISTRTPFGTGQAVRAACQGDEQYRHMAAIEVFLQLQQMVQQLPRLFTQSTDAWLQTQAPALATFLQQQGMAKASEGMRRNARHEASFCKHFFTWFDGLRAWRFVQQQRKQQPRPLGEVAAMCLQQAGIEVSHADRHESLLLAMRAWQQSV